MTTVRGDTMPGDTGWFVRRSTGASRVASVMSLALVVVLFLVPEMMGANAVQQLTSLFTFLILAIMWNALAGYGGMVSVGQQAFIGFGAYSVIFLTQHGVTPYLAVVIAAFASAALAASSAVAIPTARPSARLEVLSTRRFISRLLVPVGGGPAHPSRVLSAHRPSKVSSG